MYARKQKTKTFTLTAVHPAYACEVTMIIYQILGRKLIMIAILLNLLLKRYKK